MSYLRGFTFAAYVFTERTTLYFTVMAYVLLGHDISADKVFSMAQYFNILQATMAIFYPIAVASAAEAAVSIKRIEVRIICRDTFSIGAYYFIISVATYRRDDSNRTVRSIDKTLNTYITI